MLTYMVGAWYGVTLLAMLADDIARQVLLDCMMDTVHAGSSVLMYTAQSAQSVVVRSGRVYRSYYRNQAHTDQSE
jgi:hypothetical protein